MESFLLFPVWARLLIQSESRAGWQGIEGILHTSSPVLLLAAFQIHRQKG